MWEGGGLYFFCKTNKNLDNVFLSLLNLNFDRYICSNILHCMIARKFSKKNHLLGKPEKKVLFLVARPCTKAFSPPPPIGFFPYIKKSSFCISGTPVLLSLPLNGPATKKKHFFCGLPYQCRLETTGFSRIPGDNRYSCSMVPV